MGSGIVLAFAQAGYEVIMRDLKDEYLENGLKTINRNLDRSVKKERITADDKAAILSRITASTDINLLSDVGLVVEAAIENMKIKKEKKKITILNKLCIKCLSCIEACPNYALSMVDDEITVDHEKCILCGYCSPVCPQFCIRII